MKNRNVVTCPPCGENVGLPTKRGFFNKESFFTTPLPCYAVLPPQGGQITTRGFTLIELLVVVLIIGILAAVAVPQYQKAVLKSRYSTLKHVVEALAQAEELYYLENGEYTTSMDELNVEIPNWSLDNEYEENNIQQYLYDWGYCQLVNRENDKRAMCINSSIDMGYRRYFRHDAGHANSRRCDVRNTLDETDIRARICQEETGSKTRATSTAPQIQAWTYQ